MFLRLTRFSWLLPRLFARFLFSRLPLGVVTFLLTGLLAWLRILAQLSGLRILSRLVAVLTLVRRLTLLVRFAGSLPGASVGRLTLLVGIAFSGFLATRILPRLSFGILPVRILAGLWLLTRFARCRIFTRVAPRVVFSRLLLPRLAVRILFTRIAIGILFDRLTVWILGGRVRDLLVRLSVLSLLSEIRIGFGEFLRDRFGHLFSVLLRAFE